MDGGTTMHGWVMRGKVDGIIRVSGNDSVQVASIPTLGPLTANLPNHLGGVGSRRFARGTNQLGSGAFGTLDGGSHGRSLQQKNSSLL
jgi:hypothetical protein